MTAIKERPILFSAPMVQAILAGQKTMTRRVVKPQHIAWHRGCGERDFESIGSFRDGLAYLKDWPGVSVGIPTCPYGQPGDRLWVRSQWSVSYDESRNQAWWSGPQGCGLSFVTHGKPQAPKRLGKQSPIHMPRWVADSLRMPVVEVTGVRVERLQEITRKDAVAEGWNPHEPPLQEKEPEDVMLWFRLLWDSINNARGFGWQSNPWVWVVTFKYMEATG